MREVVAFFRSLAFFLITTDATIIAEGGDHDYLFVARVHRDRVIAERFSEQLECGTAGSGVSGSHGPFLGRPVSRSVDPGRSVVAGPCGVCRF